jgi:galactose mutarotase-like enzyme
MANEQSVDGELKLSSGELEAVFVPGAGMVGRSLCHGGEELLGQRGGLDAYVAQGRTFGIPVLYPWANRLGARRFAVAGREVVLDPETMPVRVDRGLPIHGLLAAARGWSVEDHDAARLRAAFDFAAQPALLAAFPFPHRLVLEVALSGATLTITSTVHATGEVPVPVAFGFHPYLQIPGVERAQWEIEVPVHERIVLDDRKLPTGAREAVEVESGALGERTFDDGYLAPSGGAPFVLAGGGRRIELAFGDGFRFAQVFAPEEEDVVAYEPMAAPTNALVSGDDLGFVAPGEAWSAAFSITVAS